MDPEAKGERHAEDRHGEPVLEWPTGPCDVSECELDWEWEWEGMMNDITELMQPFETDQWMVKVENFGWRKVSGTLYTEAEDAQTLLRAILPNTENWFKVYDRGDHISLNNCHHDSPCWVEWYHIYPAQEE